jgi:hypothetical protein
MILRGGIVIPVKDFGNYHNFDSRQTLTCLFTTQWILCFRSSVNAEMVYGKTGSTVDQPLMKAMISGRVPVHVFWRGQLERPFSNAGIGPCVGVQDVSPLEVRWRFPT